MLTVQEAAKYLKISSQGIYIAIKKGRIPTVRWGQQRFISKPHLDKYRKSKWKRESTYNKSKGEISVVEGAKRLKIPVQKLYYLMRRGIVPYTKKGRAYILNKETLKKVKFKRKKHARQKL